jgi:hypothetical protein
MKVLKDNRSLVKLKLDNNKFMLNRQLLGFIGDVFVYHNRTLRILAMAGAGGKSILRKEQDEGIEFDRAMIQKFMSEVEGKSLLKVFSI